MQKRIAVILVLTLGLVFLNGCTLRGREDDSLVVAIPTDPDSFHPHQSLAAATAEIAFNIYEGLVKAAPDGTVVPALAADWKIEDGGLLYIFTLREDVKFHNGRELTADDVIYCLNRLRDPQVVAKARDYGHIKSITHEGNTIKIQLDQPDAAFLAALTEFSAAIYPQEAEEQLSTQPVGTGPFILKSWQPNNEIVLERFADYWQPELVQLNQVTLRIIPEPATMVSNLLTGHVDLVPRLEPDYLHQVEGNAQLKIVESPMALVQLLAINNARPPFDDIRVRQALNYAIDREQIIEGAAWGKGQPIGSNLSPAMGAWYKDLTDYYPHDPEKAKQLLAEAGYPDGFSATLYLPAPYPLHRSAGEICADQLAAIGIHVDIQVIEWATWLEKVYTNRDFDLTVIGLDGRLDPHTVLARYESTSSRNFGNFNSPEYDRLLAQGLRETDMAARQEIYHQLQTLLAQEASNVYLMDPSQLAVMRKDVTGWRNYPVYVLDLAPLARVR